MGTERGLDERRWFPSSMAERIESVGIRPHNRYGGRSALPLFSSGFTVAALGVQPGTFSSLRASRRPVLEKGGKGDLGCRRFVPVRLRPRPVCVLIPTVAPSE